MSLLGKTTGGHIPQAGTAGASSVDSRSVGSPDHFCREERGGARGTPQWLLNEGGTPLGPSSVTPQTPLSLRESKGRAPC